MAKKIIKYILIGFASFLLLILLSGVVITTFFGSKVQELFVQGVNKNLTTELTIGGPVKLSLVKNFPQASVTFYDVELKESLPKSNRNAIEAGEISLIFNVWSLFKGDYTINKVSISNGIVNLLDTKDGLSNYHFWKASGESDEESSAFELNLQEASLNNLVVRYEDQTLPQRYKGLVKEGTLSGNFSASRFVLTTDLDLIAEEIFVKDFDYAPKSEVQVAVKLDIDTENERYAFESGKLIIADDAFAVNGFVQEEKAGTKLDIKVAGEEIGLRSLLTFLPQKNKLISDFDSKGQLDFNAAVTGVVSSKSNPHVEVNFELRDGLIVHSNMKQDLRNVSFSGSFSNGRANAASTTKLSIPHFTAILDGKPISFDLEVLNFDDPVIIANADAALDFSILGDALETEDFHGLDGALRLQDVKINGRLKDMKGRNVAAVSASGAIAAENLAFVLYGKKFSDLQANLKLEDNELRFSNLAVQIGSSDFAGDGTVPNFLGYLANSISGSEDNVLNLNATLESNVLDLNDITTYHFTSSGENSETAEVNYLPYFKGFSGRLTAEANEVRYDDFKANQVRGVLFFTPEKIDVISLKGQTLKGSMNFNGDIKVVDEWLEIAGLADFNKVDVRQLFSDFHNFGQSTMQADHLRGNLTSRMEFKLVYDKVLNFNYDRFYMLADLSVSNGELIGFQPLNDLAGYVKMSELEHIHFLELNNEIEIKNAVINIPAMYIRSTALNLLMSGTHTFSNEIDYNFKINLMDLLSRKFRVRRTSLHDVEEQKDGLVNVYVAMSGTVNDPQFVTGKRLVKDDLIENGMENRNALQFFEEEFIREQETRKPEWQEDGRQSNSHDSDDQGEDEGLDFIEWDTEDTENSNSSNTSSSGGFKPSF